MPSELSIRCKAFLLEEAGSASAGVVVNVSTLRLLDDHYPDTDSFQTKRLRQLLKLLRRLHTKLSCSRRRPLPLFLN